MEEFLLQIIKVLSRKNITPVIYGSFGASNYLGNFKVFEDIDILIDDDFIKNKWSEFRELMEANGFILIDEKEHEFEFDNKKVGFAAKDILIRDKIIKDYSELIKYKDINAYTLTLEGFLRAYQFSLKDGYRNNTRGKKDQDIINKLNDYLRIK